MTALRSTPPAMVPAPPSPPPAVDFDAVYRAEFGYVWHSLRRLGVAERDLPDLSHEVFVVVHRRLAEYDANRPLRPWLFGIALKIASHERHRAHRLREITTDQIELASSPADAEQTIDARRRHELVIAALATLSLDQRAVLVMHDIDGAPAPEIASAVGVPLNTVYSRLRRAREKFAVAVRALRETGKRGAR